MGRKSKAQLAIEAQQREKEQQEFRDKCETARNNAEEKIRSIGMPVAEYVAGMMYMSDWKKYESEFRWLAGKYSCCLKSDGCNQNYPEYDCTGKQFVTVKVHNWRAGHCGYCSEQDEDNPNEKYSEVTEEVWKVALIHGLVGNPMDLNPGCFKIHEDIECWCGGQTSTREVIDIQVS